MKKYVKKFVPRTVYPKNSFYLKLRKFKFHIPQCDVKRQSIPVKRKKSFLSESSMVVTPPRLEKLTPSRASNLLTSRWSKCDKLNRNRPPVKMAWLNFYPNIFNAPLTHSRAHNCQVSVVTCKVPWQTVINLSSSWALRRHSPVEVGAELPKRGPPKHANLDTVENLLAKVWT